MPFIIEYEKNVIALKDQCTHKLELISNYIVHLSCVGMEGNIELLFPKTLGVSFSPPIASQAHISMYKISLYRYTIIMSQWSNEPLFLDCD